MCSYVLESALTLTEQVENATTRLRTVRTDVEQAQTELKADQNTDRLAISTDIGRAAYTHYYMCALRLGCVCVSTGLPSNRMFTTGLSIWTQQSQR